MWALELYMLQHGHIQLPATHHPWLEAQRSEHLWDRSNEVGGEMHPSAFPIRVYVPTNMDDSIRASVEV